MASGRNGPTCHSLLRQALDALGREDSILRATLLGRLAGALRDQPSLGPRASLGREAVEMARRIGDPETLFYALIAQWAATYLGPDGVSQQVLLAEELNSLAEQVQDLERLSDAGWPRDRIPDPRTDLGSTRPARVHVSGGAGAWPAFSALVAGVIKTILAMSDGRFGDAESLIDETMGYGRRAQAWDAEASRLLALFVLRREQGRLDELEDEVRRMLVTHPGYRSLRCMLLVLLLEIGRGEEARVLFGQLAENDRDLPQGQRMALCDDPPCRGGIDPGRRRQTARSVRALASLQ